MTNIVGYLTATADVDIKYENDVNGIDWLVKNSDGSAYDFANKTDINLNVYDYAGGTLQLTRPEHASSGLLVAVNQITWNDDWSAINLPIGEYYYEIIYEDSATTHTTVKVVEGYIKIE